MEWWLPYAVMAAALVISMIAPMPLPRSRRDSASRRDATYDFDDVADEREEPQPARAAAGARPASSSDDDLAHRADPPRRRRYKYSHNDDLDDVAEKPAESPPPRAAAGGRSAPAPTEDDRASRAEPPRRREYKYSSNDLDDDEDDDRGAEAVRARPAASPSQTRRAPAARPVNGSGNGSANGSGGYERRTPVNRAGDAPSYFRDPTALSDWPQAKAVEEAVHAFIDRWGGSKPAATTFRKVEVVPSSNERAFAFLLAVEPERRGKETTVLARVCIPGENADRPSRFLVTKYFDHMGERFREDVMKTPQHSRGIIQVRDVPGDEGRGGAVALDFEVPLVGDPYDDIRSDDVTQYKNLLNIMRMFA